MPEPFDIGPTTLENDDVEVTTNASDELVIRDRTSSKSVTIGPNGVSVESLFSDQLTAGAGLAQRPLFSNEDQYIKVDATNGDDSNPGTDTEPLATITEALKRCPIFLRNRFVIYLEPGTYDEDLEVRNVICTGRGKGGDGGNPPGENRHEDTPPKLNLEIRGSPDLENSTTWADYEVGSIQMSGCLGAQSPAIMGVHFLRDSPISEGQGSGPESDEWAAASCHGGGSYQIRNCSFASNVTTCIKAYGSKVEARQIEVEDGVHRAGFAKHHGELQLRNVSGGGASTPEGVYATTSGKIVVDDFTGLTADNLYLTGQGAMIRHITDQWVMFDEGGSIRDMESIGRESGFSMSFFNQILDIFDQNGNNVVRISDANERLQTDYSMRPGRFDAVPGTLANGEFIYHNGDATHSPGVYVHVNGTLEKVQTTTNFAP